jgi:hypothetical protein
MHQDGFGMRVDSTTNYGDRLNYSAALCRKYSPASWVIQSLTSDADLK